MFGRRGIRSVLLTGWIASFAFVFPGSAKSDNIPSKPAVNQLRLRKQAEQLERDGKWDQALTLYLKLFEAGKSSPELREHLRTCLRNSEQTHRHLDPVFRQFVIGLDYREALNLYVEVISKTSEMYADKTRAEPSRLYLLGLEELDRALSNPTFREQYVAKADDSKIQAFQTSLKSTLRENPPAKAEDVRTAMKKLIKSASDELKIERKESASAFVFEMLCGACSGLDEYSIYVTPNGAEFLSPILELASYGILVRYVDGSLTVDDILPNSYASFQNTLQKGDRIDRINGIPMLGGDMNVLSQALRSATASHEIEYSPANDLHVAPVPAARMPIPAPTVFGENMMNQREGIGYLRLSSFRESTPRELDDAITKLRARGLRALVIDTRGNGGGLFTAARAIAEKFLQGGTIVSTQGQHPDFAGKIFTANTGTAVYQFPVVLLVDTKTMSAAEMIATALKDNGRATLVGMPTFGKGAIQSPIRLEAVGADHSGVLVLTVATMSGPNGVPIAETGVDPHVLVSDQTKQLEKAVEIARHRAIDPNFPVTPR